MTVSRPTGGAPSIWALLAIAASVCFFCPLTTLAGPLLAWRAFGDLREHPEKTGRNMARAAMAIGLLATALWIGGAWWWNRSVRAPLSDGPLNALVTGLNQNDPAGFLARFVDGDLDEATRFLEQVRGAYGSIETMVIDHEAPSYPLEGRAPVVPYQARFARGAAPVVAQFEVFAPQGGLVLRWAWLAIDDADGNPMIFPSTTTLPVPLTPAADEAPATTTAPSEADGA